MTYPCPNCGRPLKVTTAPNDQIAVHCPHGSCWSEAAGDGATGSTIEQAVGRLIEAVENETDVMP